MENHNDHNDHNGFQYTYSAKEQEELRKIREKYEHREEDKMERLRRLDRSVSQKAQAVSLIFGIVGVLILGLGMSLIMTDLSEILGSYRDWNMIVGIAIGVVGGVLVSLAYPMYNLVSKRERKKVAPEILRLSDELIKK